jgi:hypothetical protein
MRTAADFKVGQVVMVSPTFDGPEAGNLAVVRQPMVENVWVLMTNDPKATGGSVVCVAPCDLWPVEDTP